MLATSSASRVDGALVGALGQHPCGKGGQARLTRRICCAAGKVDQTGAEYGQRVVFQQVDFDSVGERKSGRHGQVQLRLFAWRGWGLAPVLLRLEFRLVGVDDLHVGVGVVGAARDVLGDFLTGDGNDDDALIVGEVPARRSALPRPQWLPGSGRYLWADIQGRRCTGCRDRACRRRHQSRRAAAGRRSFGSRCRSAPGRLRPGSGRRYAEPSISLSMAASRASGFTPGRAVTSHALPK